VGLSSPRDETRAEALRVALRAAACAADAGTGVVVRRPGGRDDPADWDERRRRGAAIDAVRDEAAKRRDEHAAHRHRHLDALCRALHDLCRAHPDVMWLLETPAAVCGVPWPGDVNQVLDELPGRRLGYWHDTAHAARLHALGVAPAESWLEAAGGVARGVTLSDWSPSASRLPPGAGVADFGALRPQLTPGMSRVLALGPTLPAAFLDEAVRQAEAIA
jgi:sugar phosphate isomerase/epimerase